MEGNTHGIMHKTVQYPETISTGTGAQNIIKHVVAQYHKHGPKILSRTASTTLKQNIK